MTKDARRAVPNHVADLREHLLDHYGQCAVSPCQCVQPGRAWIGRSCPRWQPNGATTHNELMARARRLHEERR